MPFSLRCVLLCIVEWPQQQIQNFVIGCSLGFVILASLAVLLHPKNIGADLDSCTEIIPLSMKYFQRIIFIVLSPKAVDTIVMRGSLRNYGLCREKSCNITD